PAVDQRVGRHVVPALEPVLDRLLGVEAQRRPRLRGDALEDLERVAHLVRPAVGDDRDDLALAHGSTSRAAASRSPTPPSRPASASQTKLSRLPFGPGRPEEAKPSTVAPRRWAAPP